MLGRLRDNGIENILALRGDIPGPDAFPLPGHYRYAYELIEEIKRRGDFCIGAACYPEGHVECDHQEEDILHLKQKVESGCDFLTTQMFFDNSVLYSFLYRILAKDIQVPVIAGVMPVTNGRQIQRICQLSGTSLPSRFRSIVDRFGDNPAAMKQAGIAYATEQIIDLIANGVRGIHVYTMNKPDVAASIRPICQLLWASDGTGRRRFKGVLQVWERLRSIATRYSGIWVIAGRRRTTPWPNWPTPAWRS